MSTIDLPADRGALTVSANGIEIAYRDVADGPPLVVLNGALASTGPAWVGSPVAWVDHLMRLGEHFRVVAPDTRGSGATVNTGPEAGFDRLVEDVVGLIEALDLGPVALVGFSEGGATATLVALHHPDLVSAVVNHGGFDYFDPTAMAHQTLRPIFGGSPDATAADPDAAERAFQQMGPGPAQTFATMKADYDAAQGEGHWRTYLGEFFDRTAAPFGHTVDDLAGLTVPTLILAGDRDHFCSVELACQAYRAVPECELGVVPGTGHEITPAVVTAVLDFLLRQGA